jgi:hypothetical protein
MNNTIAILLGIILLVAIGADIELNNSEYLILWGRELLVLLDWIAFWR